MDQLFILSDLLGVQWEFAHPVYMQFVDLKMVCDCFLLETLLGTMRTSIVVLKMFHFQGVGVGIFFYYT